MNKNIFAVALSACALLVSTGAMAADGTITFTGTVNAATCTIEGGGAGTGTGVVNVPMGTVTNVFAENSPQAPQDFTLKLVDAGGGACGGTGQTAALTVDPADLSTAGYIKNRGDAKNVEIRLSQAGVPISGGTIAFPAVDAKEASVTAELIRPTGAADVTEGAINAVANLSLSYN